MGQGWWQWGIGWPRIIWNRKPANSGRGQGQRPTGIGAATLTGAPGSPSSFSGVCHFCGQPGHKKADCTAFDAYMAERRRTGQSPPKGGGKGGSQRGEWQQQGGKGTFGFDFTQIDMPQHQWQQLNWQQQTGLLLDLQQQCRQARLQAQVLWDHRPQSCRMLGGQVGSARI